MLKCLAILLVLLNYVQCQSKPKKVLIQPDSLKLLSNTYITNQESNLLKKNIIDKRALIINSGSLDSPYDLYLKNYYYHNPLIYDWMKTQNKEYRYKYNKIDECGYSPINRFEP